MKKRLTVLVLMVCMLFTLAACQTAQVAPTGGSPSAPPSSPAPAAGTLTIKLGHSQVETHPYNLACMEFKKNLEANAPSPVTVELFPNCALGGEREMTEAVQLGSLEMCINAGTLATFERKLAIYDLPYLFVSRAHAYKVLDSEIGVEVASGLNNIGLHLLSYWENGFRQITNSVRPINKPEDLKGIKIRVPENAIYVESFKSWDANVTSMAWGEVFTALQQGTIDAQENSFAIAATNKLWEVQKYLSVTNHLYGVAPLLVGKPFYDGLAPEMQKAVQTAADFARDWERKYLENKDTDYIKEVEANGMTVNYADIDAFQASSAVVWDAHRSEFGDLIDRIVAMA